MLAIKFWLGMEDWNWVFRECKKLSTHWRDITAHLGLHPDDLECIKRDNYAIVIVKTVWKKRSMSGLSRITQLQNMVCPLGRPFLKLWQKWISVFLRNWLKSIRLLVRETQWLLSIGAIPSSYLLNFSTFFLILIGSGSSSYKHHWN